MTSFQQIQAQTDFRYQTAKLSREQLSKFNVKPTHKPEDENLRDIARKCGLPNNVEVDGVMKPFNTVKKQTLIDFIWVGLTEERTNLTVKTQIDEVAIHTLADESDEVTETDLGVVAERSFNAIVEYVGALWNHGSYRPTDSTIISMTGDISRSITHRFSSKTGQPIVAETVMRYKSTVKGLVSEMIQSTSSQEHHLKYVEIFNFIYGYKTSIGYQRGELDKAVATQSRTKKQHDKERLSDRKEGQSIANLINLYIEAVDILEKLTPESNPKQNQLWQKVSISLMLVTGRRLSEIMSTAKFSETIRFGWVLFEGQLKTKGLPSEPYEIPILVDFRTIDKAMVWLEAKEKRQPTPEKAHQTYSKPLSAITKEMDRSIEMVAGDAVLTCHRCRQIYAQIWKESDELTGAPHHRISMILGHGKDDNTTAVRYDADYEVRDAKAILGRFGRTVR